MLTFRSKRVVPPGGRYFYTPPETGVAIEAPTMSVLLQRVMANLAANGKAVPVDLPALAEHFMCERLPTGFCFGNEPRKTRVVSLADIRNNTLALAGTGRVDRSVASRRLDICANCEYNDRRMCPTCVGLVSWAKRLVGTGVPRDEWLGVCGIDATALPARIHFVGKQEGAEYPPHCWAGKELR